MPCRLSFASLLLLAFSLTATHFATAQTPASSSTTASVAEAPMWETNPKFVDAMKQAKLLQKQREVLFAYEAFNKANKIAGGQCTECLQGMYETQMAQGNYKEAAAVAGSLAQIETRDVPRSKAFFEQGNALATQAADKPKPALLEAAHHALQAAIAAYPKNASALFLDGKVLAKMGKMDEASADFKQCLTCSRPDDPAHLRAEHFAENPELATHKMAPPVVVTALDGSKFNLDAMGGRVVLIDFWATWCGPCNEELPSMRKIAKDFAGEPLVVISVSWDSDEAKWKQFIQKNEMTWIQYRDADHKLSEQFGVDAIPHYFTIDSDGVLTAEMLGSGSDVEGKLKKLVAKARLAHPPAAPTVVAGN